MGGNGCRVLVDGRGVQDFHNYRLRIRLGGIHLRERGAEDAREHVTRTGGGRVRMPSVHAVNLLAWGRDRGDPALVQDEAVERVGKLA